MTILENLSNKQYINIKEYTTTIKMFLTIAVTQENSYYIKFYNLYCFSACEKLHIEHLEDIKTIEKINITCNSST